MAPTGRVVIAPKLPRPGTKGEVGERSTIVYSWCQTGNEDPIEGLRVTEIKDGSIRDSQYFCQNDSFRVS